MGVGCAMLMLFMIFGYIGAAIIPQNALHYIALFGACYTFYLSYQMLKSDIDLNNEATEVQVLSFWNGFWIQALNPKGIFSHFACYNHYVPYCTYHWRSNILRIIAHFTGCSWRALPLLLGRCCVR